MLCAVSIHAPARGATRQAAHHPKGRQGFNPRAREGRDSGGKSSGAGVVVSIHAPARGATQKWSWRGRWMKCFNPRAREGRDDVVCFESFAGSGFNPRAREGRDVITPYTTIWNYLFQSTRPRGARLA